MSEEKQVIIQEKKATIPITPQVPLALVNLPDKNVPSELNKFYQEWKSVTEEDLKIEIAKEIKKKGETWRNAKSKAWFQEVIEFVEENT